MEMDVNLAKVSAIELMTISAGSYSSNNNNSCNHNNEAIASRRPRLHSRSLSPPPPAAAAAAEVNATTTATTSTPPRTGCCGILSRLLCLSASNTGKTASSSNDYNNFRSILPPLPPSSFTNGVGVGVGVGICPGGITAITNITSRVTNGIAVNTASAAASTNNANGSQRKSHHRRRTPQEIYFESRGKSCKKLLKFNGSSNKILLYPEEGWARTASSSYWTITPCWWQPNRCRIEEFSGTQRHATKAKMLPLEQKGSLLICGHFRSKKSSSSSSSSNNTTNIKDKDADEFKLYLSSNISMEDYNMGYCLTGFVERRCQQTNTFQMTHFAVIKRQWPSISNSSDAKST